MFSTTIATQPAVQRNNNEEVTLLFSSVPLLWSFVKNIQAAFFEMNTRQRMLTCRCSEEQVALALEQYSGKLAEE